MGEPLLFGLLFGKRADHPHARQIFTGDEGNPVEVALDRFIERHRPAGHQIEGQGDERRSNQEDQAGPKVDAERHNGRTDNQKRRTNHQPDQHGNRDLKLVDVVGEPGDERGRAKPVDLRVRKGVDMRKQFVAHHRPKSL